MQDFAQGNLGTEVRHLVCSAKRKTVLKRPQSQPKLEFPLARIHSHRHGKSHQTRPTSKRPPSWLTYSADEIVSLVIKLAKDGRTPGQIGVILRDEYGIPLVKQ